MTDMAYRSRAIPTLAALDVTTVDWSCASSVD